MTYGCASSSIIGIGRDERRQGDHLARAREAQSFPARTGAQARWLSRTATCFQFLDWCDELTIEVRADGAIRRTVEIAGIPPSADLCLRAAHALKEAAACPLGADIGLAKRIPVGGGLGGGSSDAATCLVALYHLWGLDWPPEKLAALGLKLGADVPVFVHGRAAWAEGVGERLTPLYPP